MASRQLKELPVINEVVYLSTMEKGNEFERLYLQVREKEGRILHDNEVLKLPFPSSNNPHLGEWKLRAQSMKRFIDCAKNQNAANILDLGCGNGWFSARLAKIGPAKIYAIDLNRTELEQAARIFKMPNLIFCYGNIFEDIFPEIKFDMIVMNSVIQYFSSITKLLNRLMQLLSKDGEIHILDSPLYDAEEIADARKRTQNYYRELGFIEMANKYYHHSHNELTAFNQELLYEPKRLTQQIRKLLGTQDSPFPWIKITAL